MRALVLLVVLLLPVAGAVHAPAGPTPLAAGTLETYVHRTDCANGGGPPELAPKEAGKLCARWNISSSNTRNVTLRIVVEGSGVSLGAREANLTIRDDPLLDYAFLQYLSVDFTVPAESASGTISLTATVTQHRNGTLIDSKTFGWHVSVLAPPAPPGSNTLLLAALAVAVAAGGVGLYALTRKRQVKAAPKSSAMRQVEVERKLERAKAPEEKAALEAEIAKEEATRALSREAQIVEAKIKDVRASIDRLRERFESGTITQHQFDQMRSKREQNLEELTLELERLLRGT